MKGRLNLPLVVTVSSWGFNFVAVKVLYAEMTAPVVALLRYVVMFALLATFCLARGDSLIPRKEDIGRILFAGLITMGAYQVFFMEGMRGTTPAEGAIVLATIPIFVFLLSCLVGQEKFSGSALVGTIVGFLGVTLVILGGSAAGHGSVRGNLTILLGAFTWACSTVMMRPLITRYPPTAVFTMSMVGGLPIIVPYGLGPTLATDFGKITPYGWLMFASVSLLSGVVAHVCFYMGLRQIGASRTSLYQYFVPPVAAFFAWLVLAKPLGLVQFLGLAIVLGGVAYAGHARARAVKLAAA